MFRATLFALSLSLVPSTTYATFEITSTPRETSGPFLHNVFHTASNSSGNGSALVWFDLDTDGGKTSTYDNVSGDLVLHVKLYTNSGLGTQVGTATATGNFTASEFNGHDGGIVGSMTWNFNITSQPNSNVTDFVSRIGGVNGSTTMTFFDEDYVTSGAGFTANELVNSLGGSMTLWGANGTPNASNSTYSGQNLGMDLVMLFGDSFSVVPAPPSLALALIGIAGCPFFLRRRKTKPVA